MKKNTNLLISTVCIFTILLLTGCLFGDLAKAEDTEKLIITPPDFLTIQITTNSEAGSSVGTYTANKNPVTWGLEGNDASSFEISADGELTITAKMEARNYYYTVTAIDSEGNKSTLKQILSVIDLNAPNVTAPNSLAAISTLSSAGTSVGAFKADKTGITWGLEGPDATYFEISATGELTIKTALLARSYSFTIIATDVNGNKGKVEQQLIVSDKTKPIITAPTLKNTITQTSVPGTPVGTYEADKAVISWKIEGTDASSFNITADGELTISVELEIKTYHITVTATDASGNKGTLDQIIDVIDAPTITAPFTLAEITVTSLPGTVIGTYISDEDPVTWGIEGPDASSFAISSAGELTISAVLPINFYTIVITATNSLGNKGILVQTISVTLANVYNENDTAQFYMDTTASVTTAQIDSSTYLFVTGENDNGISVFQVGDTGELTNKDNVEDNDVYNLKWAYSSTFAEVGNTAYLFVTGYGDNGVSVFSVSDNGELTNVNNVNDSDNQLYNLYWPMSIVTAEVGGITYLFIAGREDFGVSVFKVSNQGKLTNVDNVDDNHIIYLNEPSALTIAEINDTTYLFVAGFNDSGVSVFRVSDQGKLTNVANMGDDFGFELDGASSVTTAIVGNFTYLFVAGKKDNGVSMFRVGNDGSLTNVDNVDDDDADMLELSEAHSVTTAEVEGTVYLFVAGRNDDGVSVFSVAGDGTLANVANVSDDDKLNLKGAQSVTAIKVEEYTYLFVGGYDDDGVSVFKVNP